MSGNCDCDLSDVPFKCANELKAESVMRGWEPILIRLCVSWI